MLGRRTDDTMSHEESDFELDVFPYREPVKFIADGGRNAVELRNTQDQPCSQVQDGLKSVEKISIRPVEDTVTMIDSACDEGVHECQQYITLHYIIVISYTIYTYSDQWCFNKVMYDS